MRDPDLLKRAHLAAAGIERAWYRWRVGQGLLHEPMPTISSYVGYSLEERGEPRVVFGMTAGDAERLAALLEQRARGADRGSAAAKPAGPDAALAASSLPLPVPPQAPSVAAEQSGPWHQQARFPAPADAASGAADGPVYRELTATQGLRTQQSAPADAVAAPESEPEPEPADAHAADHEQAAARGAGAAEPDETGRGDAAPAGARPAEPADEASAAAVADGEVPSSAGPAGGPSDDGPGQAEPPGSDEREEAVSGSGRQPASPPMVGAGSGPAGSDPGHGSQHGDFVTNDMAVTDDAADEHVHLLFGPAVRPGAGPLALAASAARLEAEARIRAAAGQAASVQSVLPPGGPRRGGQLPDADALPAGPARGPGADQRPPAEPEGRQPESGSGARADWHTHGGLAHGGHAHEGTESDDHDDATQPDLTSVLGRPGSGLRARSGRTPRGIAAAAQVGRRIPGLRATS